MTILLGTARPGVITARPEAFVPRVTFVNNTAVDCRRVSELAWTIVPAAGICATDKVRYSEMLLLLRETSHGKIRMRWLACSHQSDPTLADAHSAGEK